MNTNENQPPEQAASHLPETIPLAGAAGLNHLHDADLRGLIEAGQRSGYLTFDQINAYLPDEAVDPEKIDALLVALDDRGIELVEELPEETVEAPTDTAAIAEVAPPVKAATAR